MIKTKKELQFYIMADRIKRGYPPHRSFLELIKNIISPDYILMYLRYMRLASYYSRTSSIIRHWYNNRFYKLGVKLGFTIGYDVFGYGLVIPHYGTIVVNSNVRAGNYCVLHTSTCIAGGGEVLSDYLYLSSGAVIVKGVELGPNVSIAANSLVNSSFPQGNVVLAGSPATIVKNGMCWVERDGDIFVSRRNSVEQLKKIMFS